MDFPIPLIGPSYQSREIPLSAQANKNLRPQFDPEGKSQRSLHDIPGLKVFASGLTGNYRGHHKMDGVYYIVNGTTLYSVDSTGTEVSRGTIEGQAFCGFADDGDNLLIVTGGPWYSYVSATTTLTEGTDTDLVNPTTVTYLNQQFLFDNNSPTSAKGEFVSSKVGDGTDISALDFAVAESHPDDIIRLKAYNRLVYMFGGLSLEPWHNTGVGRPPFDPVQGGIRTFGIAGRDAVTEQDGILYFLTEERVPRRMAGFESVTIGNNALGKDWQKYSRVDDCIVFGFNFDHQDYVIFAFPVASRTWAFHVPSATWFQLTEGDGDDRWRGSGHIYIYGKHLVPDHSNGKVYELDDDTFTNDGNPIHRKRTTANIHSGIYGSPGRSIFFGTVEIDVLVGQGLETGQGSDPELMVRFSDDGGYTWSAEIMYPLGRGGDYLQKVKMPDQGMAYQRVYEVSYSDPTLFALFSMHGEMSFGQS